MKKQILISALFFTISSFAAGKVHMVAQMANMSCLQESASTNKVIEYSGMKLKGANHAEKKLVAKVYATVEDLTNQQQAERILGGLTIVFQDHLGNRTDGACLPAHQMKRNHIYMARKCPNGTKIPYREGILVHEIGHFVANKLGLYGKYDSAVGKKCKMTSYMYKSSTGRTHSNRREEFAEVFAGFLVAPKKLKKSCRKQYNYIKDQLFLGMANSCENKKSSSQGAKSFLSKIFSKN